MKRLSAALLIFFGLVSAALAQQTQNNLTGKECWAAGQGPPICSNLVRNTSAVVIYQLNGNVTIGTYSTDATLSSGGYALITAQPLRSTITLPPNPFPDGGIIHICNATPTDWIGNAVNVVANVGQTAPTGPASVLTTLAAAQCVHLIFYRATSTWYKVT